MSDAILYLRRAPSGHCLHVALFDQSHFCVFSMGDVCILHDLIRRGDSLLVVAMDVQFFDRAGGFLWRFGVPLGYGRPQSAEGGSTFVATIPRSLLECEQLLVTVPKISLGGQRLNFTFTTPPANKANVSSKPDEADKEASSP